MCKWRYISDGKCIASLRFLWWTCDILCVLHIHNHRIEVLESQHSIFETLHSMRLRLNCMCFFICISLVFCSAEIAKDLPEDSYGLIFGVNTFFAYCLQAILTVVVAADSFNLKLNIFQQMNIYGAFLALVGCLYFVLMVIDGIQSMRNRRIKKSDSQSSHVNGTTSITI